MRPLHSHFPGRTNKNGVLERFLENSFKKLRGVTIHLVPMVSPPSVHSRGKRSVGSHLPPNASPPALSQVLAAFVARAPPRSCVSAPTKGLSPFGSKGRTAPNRTPIGRRSAAGALPRLAAAGWPLDIRHWWGPGSGPLEPTQPAGSCPREQQERSDPARAKNVAMRNIV